MTELKPYLVTAPLNINCIETIDTNTIYVFDYENSLISETNKPEKMITYLESLGGLFDIFVNNNISYEDKEQLLLNYFNAGSFFNINSLVETMIKILFRYKNIDVKCKSILNDDEINKFLDRNKIFVKEIIKFYNSLFLFMLIFASKREITIKEIKQRYSVDKIDKTEYSPNICNLLLYEEFYDYYSKHIGTDLYYYEFMFENRLYRNMTFLDILDNKSNSLLPTLRDMTNKKFLDYIEEQKKRS